MNLYEHTIIARQDSSVSQIKQIKEKYINIINKNKGNIVQTQEWGLMNLSYLIKKNRKGNYIHFKIEGDGSLIKELEKNEKLDKNLLRYLTVKVKKFDLETNYFSNDEKKTKRVNIIKIQILENLFNKPISEVYLNIDKIEKFGKSFEKLTKDTVLNFLKDSKKSKFKI